jgi:hypothetical protein
LLASGKIDAQKKQTAKNKNSLKHFSVILKITLESDSSTKSALISNLNEEKSGDMSPVIGAASWLDNDKTLQCNSLIEFDFNLIPVEIKKLPSIIIRADLVLYPINVEFVAKDNEKPRIIHIQQVRDNWEDTTVKWKNQPTANTEKKSD